MPQFRKKLATLLEESDILILTGVIYTPTQMVGSLTEVLFMFRYGSKTRLAAEIINMRLGWKQPKEIREMRKEEIKDFCEIRPSEYAGV